MPEHPFLNAEGRQVFVVNDSNYPAAVIIEALNTAVTVLSEYVYYYPAQATIPAGGTSATIAAESNTNLTRLKVEIPGNAVLATAGVVVLTVTYGTVTLHQVGIYVGATASSLPVLYSIDLEYDTNAYPALDSTGGDIVVSLSQALAAGTVYINANQSYY